MRAEPSENNGAADEDDAGDGPEVGGQLIVPLPEPDVVDEAFAVAFDDVVDGVEFDHVEVFGGEHFGGPEDGGHPEEELDDHGDDLSHVAEEDDDRRGQPGEAEEEDDRTEEIVDHLEAVEGDRPAVDQEHGEDDDDEKSVQDEGGEDLDNGEHADAEVDLFEEKGIFHDGTGGAVETFTEEKPGDYAAEHPENKGDIAGGLGFEADLEDDPEDGNVDSRVNEGPENAKVGAEIFAAEILLRQFEDHPPPLEEIFDEKEENAEIVHVGGYYWELLVK